MNNKHWETMPLSLTSWSNLSKLMLMGKSGSFPQWTSEAAIILATKPISYPSSTIASSLLGKKWLFRKCLILMWSLARYKQTPSIRSQLTSCHICQAKVLVLEMIKLRNQVTATLDTVLRVKWSIWWQSKHINIAWMPLCQEKFA